MNWKKFFDSLGLNGTQWQWRILRLKQYFERQQRRAEQQKGQITYQHHICKSCGALADRREKACPKCGDTIGAWHAEALKRFLQPIFPKGNFVSSLILMACVVVAGVYCYRFGVPSFLSPSPLFLEQMGALVPLRVTQGLEYWRVITYGYLHIGLMHILFNGMALLQVGPALEHEIGSRRFFTVYTLSLLGGAFADLWYRGYSFVTIAGASGALFGLIGFGISYCHFYGKALHDHRNFFLRWALYSFLFAFFIRADNIAHAGGLIVGVVLGFFIERERKYRRRFDALYSVLSVLALLATVVSFIQLGLYTSNAAELKLEQWEEGEID